MSSREKKRIPGKGSNAKARRERGQYIEIRRVKKGNEKLSEGRGKDSHRRTKNNLKGDAFQFPLKWTIRIE